MHGIPPCGLDICHERIEQIWKWFNPLGTGIQVFRALKNGFFSRFVSNLVKKIGLSFKGVKKSVSFFVLY